MKNLWLNKVAQRTIIREVNLLLSLYVGKTYHDTPSLAVILENMRLDVLEFFHTHPDKLKHFVVGGSISYRFNVQGKHAIESVVWEPRML